MSGPIEQGLTAALEAAFAPRWLQVVNESSNHSVPAGSETHFQVVVVSDRFEGSAPLARHRQVHAAAGPFLQAGVHALSIFAWTPEQWAQRQGAVPESPACRGGSKAG